MANPTSAHPTPTTTPPPPPPPLSPAASPALPPTTFVQADPQTFRDVVQKLTGAAMGDAPDKLPVTATARPAVGPRRPAFKLQERRPVRKLEIKLGRAPLQSTTQSSSPHHYLLPQMVAAMGGLIPKSPPFPSPVSPLGSHQLFSPVLSAEERAISEKGFYLHPSPRAATPRGSDPPELLPLFPLTSPRKSKPAEEESSS